MHRLQQHILRELITHPSRRYAQLKPAEVEGNLFMYHLRALMKPGLVIKQADGSYALSPEGKRYADTLSLKTFIPRLQPRIIILVVCQNEKGEWLLQRRERQPIIDRVGFVHLEIRPGQAIAQTATEGFLRRTGLSAKLTHRGDGYITFSQDGEPESQTFFHLFMAKDPTGELRAHSSTGTTFWGSLEGIDESYLPSIRDLLELLGKHPNDRFFCELEYQV